MRTNKNIGLINEAPIQGAKVTAVICDPLPGEWGGSWPDDYFIRIYMQGTWVTPAVGMFMKSRAVGGTGAWKNYLTSWKIISIQSYGTVEGDREGYHKCTMDRPGCMDPLACNFKAHQQINVDDGSCIFPGCDDPNADNYNPNLPPNCACDDVDGDGRPDCCQYPGCTNPGALNYNQTANVDDGSCQLPTTYTCSDGQCVLDVNGQYANKSECLVDCASCAHPECFYCPGPTKTISQNPTNQGCTTIGSQWLQALNSGIQLYPSITDCESESDCGGSVSPDTKRCHCCDGQGKVQVMPGLYTDCKIINKNGASLNPNGWVSNQWSKCSPVSQPISCGDKGNKKPKPDGKQNIREDVERMKGLINY